MKMSIIKENRDFKRIYYRGKSFVSPYLIVYVFKNNRSDEVRYGITASKKVGNAVHRNRAKRIIRAAFSSFDYRICKGYDIIFIARNKTTLIKSTDLVPIMSELFEKSGILEQGMV